MDLTATVGAGPEFPEALAADASAGGGPVVNALYSIDLSEDTIDYTMVSDEQDPFWTTNYRLLEAGVQDRYYLAFPDGHNVSGGTATDDAVSITVQSDTVLVVEVGEGFDVNPGAAFSLSLEAL